MCLWGSVAGVEDGGEKKRVVVIGGGVGGSLLAYSIQFSAHVVLIDQKEYFDLPYARMRAVVEPSFAKRSLINHSDYLSNVQIVVSAAIDITDSEVLTDQGQTIGYDYLVVATGHAESVPTTRTERLSHFQAEFQKLASANSVLIVGGGPTGVELAGEIAVDYPDKKVVLAHHGMRLLEFIGSRASQKALEWLTSRKVEVVLDQTIKTNSLSDSIIQTSAGETIKADVHFMCTGNPIGSSWLKETILRDSLDLHDRLTVDENLRVRGHKNIFAIGDITNIPEIKQGYVAQRHALVMAKNLRLLMMGGNESKMFTYKPGPECAIISLGRKEGVAQYPLMTIIGGIPGMIKSADLFVGKIRKTLGLQSSPAD